MKVLVLSIAIIAFKLDSLTIYFEIMAVRSAYWMRVLSAEVRKDFFLLDLYGVALQSLVDYYQYCNVYT